MSKIRQWFIANRLSLNVKKTKHIFFHKNSAKDYIPLKLPDIQIANKTIEKTFLIKFLGVMLDENITWKDHIYTAENKIEKNLGLLYRAKQLLNEESLKITYFSHIHSNLNDVNVAWASTHYTKLKTTHFQKKTQRGLYLMNTF